MDTPESSSQDDAGIITRGKKKDCRLAAFIILSTSGTNSLLSHFVRASAGTKLSSLQLTAGRNFSRQTAAGF